MPVTAAVASAALPAIGGLVGYAASQGDVDQARRLREQALQRILGVNTPDMLAQQANLEQYKQVADLPPAILEEIISAGPSKFEGISTDPRLAAAQMKALSGLEERGETGLTAKESAELKDIRRQTARDEQNRRASILQNMAQRGMGGSGAELASALSGSQAAAERQSQEGDKEAAMIQERALQSLLGAGQLGGSIRGQEFGEKSSIAQAQDEMNKFNVANQISQQARNVGRQNTTAQQQFEFQQGMANQNVGLRNQEQLHNKELLQQQFRNQMQKEEAAGGALGRQAAGKDEEAKRTAALWAGLGQAAGQGAGAAGKYAGGA